MAIALIPVGFIASGAVAFVLAALLGVTLDSADGSSLTFAQNALVWGVAGAVWLAAPAVAVLLAIRPAREGNRFGTAALVVAGLLALAGLALLFTTLVLL